MSPRSRAIVVACAGLAAIGALAAAAASPAASTSRGEPGPTVAPASAAAPARGAGPTLSATSAAVLPPALVALEQKTAELKITSLLFSLHVSIQAGGHAKGIDKLLKLFDITASGEVSVSQPAAIVTLQLFGATFRVRVLGNVAYVEVPGLGPHDGGRPWVNLEGGNLGELFAPPGKHRAKHPTSPAPVVPRLAEPSFTALERALSEAREVRELAAGSIEGQVVSRFLAVLSPTQLKEGSPLAEASRARVGAARKRPRPPASPPTLEVSLAQSGLPLRTVITQSEGKLKLTAQLDIPVINFRLQVVPPPSRQTIGLSEFRRLAKRAAERAKRRTRMGRRRRK
jgi:hypothetical protein